MFIEKLIAIIFVLSVGIIVYDVFYGQLDLYWIYGALLALAAGLIMIRDWINYEATVRFRIGLTDRDYSFLESHWYLFPHIAEEDREDFSVRTNLRLQGSAFHSKSKMPIPQEVRMFLSATATYIEMTYDVVFPDINYVLYNHPFVTTFHDELHLTEYDKQDHAMIFSIPHLLHGMHDPLSYVDIVLYQHLTTQVDDYGQLLETPQNIKLDRQDLQRYMMNQKINWDCMALTLQTRSL